MKFQEVEEMLHAANIDAKVLSLGNAAPSVKKKGYTYITDKFKEKTSQRIQIKEYIGFSLL